jgi:hypothetical protein
MASIPVKEKSYHPTITYREGTNLALHKVNSTAASATSASIRIEIVHHLRVDVGPPSQTVVARLIEGDVQCHTDGATRAVPVGSTVVAKIYDPEYVWEEGIWKPDEDEKSCAEAKSNEVKAYNLLSHMQGHDIPIFYGEYSYARRLGSNISVILMEYVTDPVLCLVNVHPSDANTFRSASFALLKRVHDSGVYHHDVAARNMLWSRDKPRLTLLDFEQATFWDTLPPDSERMVELRSSWEVEDRALLRRTLRAKGIQI